jgi:uncharacterized protein YcbX
MTARIAALFRYPIKGFAPERRIDAHLEPGAAFPGDRLWAMEDGPSGFDPAKPAWVSKQRFAVLAKFAEVARARTRVDDDGRLTATADGLPEFSGDLTSAADRARFCAWFAPLLQGQATGPLRLLEGAGHRFLDHPLGHVSVLNLASVRDLGEKLGREIDPLRFRANVHVDGWPAWVELGWEGRPIAVGGAATAMFKPIVRCTAPDVDPASAARDLETTAELFRHYGHMHMGVYVHVTKAGRIAEGDTVETPPAVQPSGAAATPAS